MTSPRQRGPQVPLDNFPTKRWGAENSFYRVAGMDANGNWYSPWWFCTDQHCRFDLPVGHARGTLYAATDKISGVLEYVGDHEGAAVTMNFLSQRRIYELAYDVGFELAHLSSSSAVGFGATNSLSAMLDLTVPQQWALEFDRLEFEGIFYCARHVTSGRATALALFDVAGSHSWVVREITEVTEDSIIRQLSRRGIEVELFPTLSDFEEK